LQNPKPVALQNAKKKMEKDIHGIQYGMVYFAAIQFFHHPLDTALRRYSVNDRSQMQGGKNWILPLERNADRFF
jgi:hypothetical protein